MDPGSDEEPKHTFLGPPCSPPPNTADQAREYTHYSALEMGHPEGTWTFRIKDTLELNGEKNGNFLAQIMDMWQQPNGHKIIRVRWFYRQSDFQDKVLKHRAREVPEGKLPRNEVFLLETMEENQFVESINGKAWVLDTPEADDEFRSKNSDFDARVLYFCRSCVDVEPEDMVGKVKNCSFRPLPDGALGIAARTGRGEKRAHAQVQNGAPPRLTNKKKKRKAGESSTETTYESPSNRRLGLSQCTPPPPLPYRVGELKAAKQERETREKRFARCVRDAPAMPELLTEQERQREQTLPSQNLIWSWVGAQEGIKKKTLRRYLSEIKHCRSNRIRTGSVLFVRNNEKQCWEYGWVTSVSYSTDGCMSEAYVACDDGGRARLQPRPMGSKSNPSTGVAWKLPMTEDADLEFLLGGNLEPRWVMENLNVEVQAWSAEQINAVERAIEEYCTGPSLTRIGAAEDATEGLRADPVLNVMEKKISADARSSSTSTSSSDAGSTPRKASEIVPEKAEVPGKSPEEVRTFFEKLSNGQATKVQP
ncbi:unnamed protein product [Chrysoparadoxa australica]